MIDFSLLRNRIDSEIERLEYNSKPKELYDPIRYSMSLGGKRIRPLLVLAGCDLLNGNIQDAVKPALGFELFHNFTLLHDDIMDNAPLRRSMPTVHAKWDANTAILSGDAMFVQACKLIAHTHQQHLKIVLDIFHTAALQVCEGQQLDMNYEKEASISIDSYLSMIELKTAVLLAACIKTGAVLAGEHGINAELLYGFGKNIGIAFQLQDDMLDVYGASKFGKQAGGDIISNKKTFLLLKALELAGMRTKNELLRWTSSTDFDPEEKVKAVTAIFNELEISKHVSLEIDTYFNEGVSLLNKVGADEGKIKSLLEFAESLMKRDV